MSTQHLVDLRRAMSETGSEDVVVYLQPDPPLEPRCLVASCTVEPFHVRLPIRIRHDLEMKDAPRPGCRSFAPIAKKLLLRPSEKRGLLGVSYIRGCRYGLLAQRLP